jgi:endo-1,4-beta-xylanase
LTGALGLAACGGRTETATAQPNPPRPLRETARCPIGTCVGTDHIGDPAWVALATRHFSQLTPEFEMKMEYVLQPDGSFRFDGGDRIVAFARANGQRLYGTTLIWYEQDPAAFHPLDGSGKRFADAYRSYILAIAGRYRGQVVGWDTVNEPVAEDGNGLRQCIWSRNLGQEDYIVRAFEHAAEADPNALLFLNEYNLEHLPRKQATFLKLVERLLSRGVPIGGLGTQSHLDISLKSGVLTQTIRRLGEFGLPIHVSELDISLKPHGFNLPVGDPLQRQADLVTELAEAFMALPQRQRFAFTAWGIRDRDSWLLRRPGGTGDRPLLFDEAGEPKAAFHALQRAVSA